MDESGHQAPKRRANEYAAMLCLLTALLSFVFVRIYDRGTVFMVQGGGDDAGYLAHSEALLRYHTWDWCAAPFISRTLAEECSSGRRPVYNKYSPGPALSVLPLNALGLVLERTGLVRTSPLDPLVFWSLVGAYVLFLGATLLMWKVAIVLGCSPRLAFWATSAMAVGSPVLYYVFRRPLMSHAAEFFWFSAAAFFLLKRRDAPALSGRAIFAAGLGVSAGMLAIVRFNDAPVAAAFVAGGMLVDRTPAHRARGLLFELLGAAAPLAFLGGELWAQLHGAALPPYDPAGHWVKAWPLTLAFPERVAGFFFGAHWGIVLLTPFVAIELAVVAARWKRLAGRIAAQKWVVSLLAVAGGAELLLAASFFTNGMSYGARYVFTVYWLVHIAFLLAVGTAPAPAAGWSTTRRRLVTILAAATVLVGALNLGSFESAPGLTPRWALVRDEGVSNPEFATLEGWATPRFTTRALRNALAGRAVVTFGSSPIVAYPFLAARDLFGEGVPAPQALLDYYRKRGISTLGDLRTLMLYHLFVGLISAGAAAGFRRSGRRAESSQPAGG